MLYSGNKIQIPGLKENQMKEVKSMDEFSYTNLSWIKVLDYIWQSFPHRPHVDLALRGVSHIPK